MVIKLFAALVETTRDCATATVKSVSDSVCADCAAGAARASAFSAAGRDPRSSARSRVKRAANPQQK